MTKKSKDHKAKRDHHDAGKSSQGEGSHSASSHTQKDLGASLTGGSKSKNGCFPKLVMLLLPFVVAGSYLYLSS